MAQTTPDLTLAAERPAYINWPAVFAGNAVTGGLILVLLPIGAAGGLAMTSAYPAESASARTIGTAAIVWLAFMYLFTVSVGGYVVGRLRPRVAESNIDEIRFRDGANGFVFWGVGMIVSALLTFLTLTSAAGTATQAIGSAAGGAVSAAAEALPANTISDVLLRSAQPQAGTTQPRSEADVRAEVVRMISSAVVSGEMTDTDKQYLVTLVAQRTGLPENEAKARVDQASQRAVEVQRQAQATAEKARKAAAQAAFWTAVLSLLSGIGAASAAMLGGQHRDENRYV